MLSYQHAFHAGNHADVIKHLSWMGVLNHLKKKNKPFTLFDTHSGAGEYDLGDELASKNKEFESGVVKIASVATTDDLLSEYIALCQSFLAENKYMGSPLLSAMLKRDMDSAHLMELHPGEYEKLCRAINPRKFSACHLHHRDGFEGLKALTPPKPNRGAILIDPPYERIEEYTDVVNAIERVLGRWKQAHIVLWYPLLSARAEKKAEASLVMREQLAELGIPCFKAELEVVENTPDSGMYGSGVFVLNPPWQLDVNVSKAITEIVPYLGDNAHFSLDWVVDDQ
ncbi:23S rRNA (adenine(2030)-N(6))-methyltransferase RlmJ [Alteromonas sp. 345S023]|uniref:Ribosomal RNA large subunit methyltransferase J n=1 Tax=Alteromonas profundi TaxID=2696062 RepID=A0A7X5LL12_9ALTE|nr:23S rRNA (adenine(2030)-N(6))-methyltransferase RlmJ [Alteromonas profundi]